MFGRKKKKRDDSYADDELPLLMEKLFKTTEDFRVNMGLLEKLAGRYPRPIFEGVKNPEEFDCRRKSLYYSIMGAPEKSMEYADKGLEINPRSAYLLYMRGRAKGDTNRFEEGIEDLSVALKLKPSFADALVERGYIKQKIGDTKGAEEDYKKAREIDPSVVLPE